MNVEQAKYFAGKLSKSDKYVIAEYIIEQSANNYGDMPHSAIQIIRLDQDVDTLESLGMNRHVASKIMQFASYYTMPNYMLQTDFGLLDWNSLINTALNSSDFGIYNATKRPTTLVESVHSCNNAD